MAKSFKEISSFSSINAGAWVVRHGNNVSLKKMKKSMSKIDFSSTKVVFKFCWFLSKLSVWDFI